MANPSEQAAITATPVESEIVMRGDGNYNKNSAIQHIAVMPALEFIPNLSNRKELTLVDYGCSQGANSIIPIKHLLSQLPTHSTIRLIFNDRPPNDFSTLSKTIKRNEATLSRNGELQIYPSMVPVSFFHQIVPDNSVDIGFAWSCLHYLEFLLPPLPSTDLQELVKQRLVRSAKAAHVDLVKLLRLRAREIKSGGVFIGAIAARSSSSVPNVAPAAAALIVAISEMVHAGRISQAQVMGLDMPVHEHSMEEMESAFTEVEEVWGKEVCFEKMIQHPAVAELEAKKKAEGVDLEELSKEYASTVVDWTMAPLTWFLVKVLRAGNGGMGEEEMFASMTAEEEGLVDELAERAKRVFVKDQRDGIVEQCYIYFKLVRK